MKWCDSMLNRFDKKVVVVIAEAVVIAVVLDLVNIVIVNVLVENDVKSC